jgi:hypothetical protein
VSNALKLQWLQSSRAKNDQDIDRQPGRQQQWTVLASLTGDWMCWSSRFAGVTGFDPNWLGQSFPQS